jgi:sulfate permease, SulP family
VTVGVVLAALLLMRRMSEVFSTRALVSGDEGAHPALPRGVVAYEIAGPLFFGAAQKAIQALQFFGDHSRVVILDVHSVPVLDVTGLVALESAISRLHKRKALVILAGVQPQAARVLARSALKATPGKLQFASSMQEAADEARAVITPSAELRAITAPPPRPDPA